MNNFGKNLVLWVIIGLLLIALFNLFQGTTPRGTSSQVAFSEFLSQVDRGQVSDVTIQGQSIRGHFTDGRSFATYAPQDPNYIQKLTGANVRITAVPTEEPVHPLLSILASWFPFLILIGVWVFFMRQMQSGGGRAMGFGKSRARLLTEKVAPVYCSGWSFFSLAFPARSLISAEISARPLRFAPRTTGVIRPSSMATATPMSACS